jgi:sugar phosphate isomerase/epimerase
VTFLIMQSMWAMERLPWKAGEWSLEEKVSRIADAGFDGAAVEFDDYDGAKRTTQLLRERGLRWSVECYPKTVDELKPVIEDAYEFGIEHATHVNLQPNVKPERVLECIPYILGWLELSRDLPVPVFFETHRDRMTTDLFFTLQLIDAVPEMRLTADLSHAVVGREFRWPVSREDQAQIERILERAWAFHGRVASREQVQIQISFPHHRQWLDLFLNWWEQGFRSWRDRAPSDAELTFTSELGPPDWYAITGPDGDEMSDRWEEALQLKDEVTRVWNRVAGDPATVRADRWTRS